MYTLYSITPQINQCQSCPRFWTHYGACKRSICSCFDCRRAWGRKRAWCLVVAQQYTAPYSHRVRITPPVNFQGIDRWRFITRWLSNLQESCREKGYRFDAYLLPHKTPLSQLHWDGVIRTDDEGLELAKRLLRNRMGGSLRGKASFIPLTSLSWFYYMCGRGKKRVNSLVVGREEGGRIVKADLLTGHRLSIGRGNGGAIGSGITSSPASLPKGVRARRHGLTARVSIA